MHKHSSQRLNLGKLVAALLSSICVTACAQHSLKDCARLETKQTSNVSLAQMQESSTEPEHKKAALVNIELGLNYLSSEQFARAKHKLMHAAQLAPNAVEPHSALAYFFEKSGDIKEAEQEHKKALRLGGNKGAVSNNYAVFLYKQNRFKEAKQAFQRALADKQYAHSAEVHENAGLCALKLFDMKQAEQYFYTAVRQDPKRSQALLELAAIKVKQQNLKEAEDLLWRHKSLVGLSEKSLLLNNELATLQKESNKQGGTKI